MEENIELTLEEMREILTPAFIADALVDGSVYVREERDEVQACFPNDRDPGCQMSYVIVSNDVQEWNTKTEVNQWAEIADTLYYLAEDDYDSYATEVSFYISLMEGIR